MVCPCMGILAMDGLLILPLDFSVQKQYNIATAIIEEVIPCLINLAQIL